MDWKKMLNPEQVCLEHTGLPKKNETSETTKRNYYGLFL